MKWIVKNSKIRKEWEEEQAAKKKPKISYLDYNFNSSDSEFESYHKRPRLISQKGLKLLSSDDESDDLKASSFSPCDTTYIDRCKKG